MCSSVIIMCTELYSSSANNCSKNSALNSVHEHCCVIGVCHVRAPLIGSTSSLGPKPFFSNNIIKHWVVGTRLVYARLSVPQLRVLLLSSPIVIPPLTPPAFL